MNRIELFNVLKIDPPIGDVANPFFQGRLVRIYAKLKVGCRIFLGHLTFEEFMQAYSELDVLLGQGKVVGLDADLALSEQARNLKWCNFLTLRNLLENHNHLVSSLPLTGRFTDFQMFALIALTDLGFAEQALMNLNLPYQENVEDSCALLIDFSACLLGAEEALTYILESLTLRVTGAKIDELYERVTKQNEDRKKGGQHSRFNMVRPLFVSEAKKKWEEQKISGLAQFKKKDMCDYLINALSEHLPPHPSRHGEKVKPSIGTIWDEWLVDIKPEGARNKSQNK